MTNALERRETRAAVELRAADDGRRVIGGYALKFNRLSQNLGGFVERIDPGFTAKSEGDGWPDVMARYNHDQLLGTTAAGSLRLSVDGNGLVYEVDMLTDSVSERVFQLVSRGDVSRSSFAFHLAPGGDDWSLTEDGFPLRTLLAGKVVDVAPVDQPAYQDTSTGLRSLAERRGLDESEVAELAKRDALASLLKHSPIVVDLGAVRARARAAESAARFDQGI